MMNRKTIIGGIVVLILLIGGILLWQKISEPTQLPAQPTQELKLSDFPEVFKENTVIVIGENASEIERQAAEEIKNFLLEQGSSDIKITASQNIENFKKGYNLVIIGTPKTNPFLEEVYALTNATRVTEEFPGEGKGVLNIMADKLKQTFTDFKKISYVFLLVGFTLNETKIKWRRKGALIGGIWGLICGVWYGWNSLVTGFSPYDVISSMFDGFFEMIIFFPAFVTDSITNYLFNINETLIMLAVPIFALVLWFFIVWSTKISRKICIGGSLLLLILTIYPRFPLGFLSIVMWFAVIPFLLSIVFGILLASILFIFSRAQFEEVRA